jgi:hypothetical protein
MRNTIYIGGTEPLSREEHEKEIRKGGLLREISGSEIIELAEALKRGAEGRLWVIETQPRSWWDRETETLNKLNCSRITNGIRNKGLQEVIFKVSPPRYGGNLLRSRENQDAIMRQILDKETRHEISGRELMERIDRETGFLESCISDAKQLDNIRQAQKEYTQLVKPKSPEKDVAAVIQDRISTLKKARVDLKGLENDSFTLPRNDIYSTIRNPEFIKKVEKLHEIQLTGSELTKRIDGELEYFRESIDTPEKRERLRAVQSAYKTTPEKDVVTIVEEKITDLEVARLNLKGLEKATFTVKGRDNIHSIVKSPDFAKQIKRENGRFVSRDR